SWQMCGRFRLCCVSLWAVLRDFVYAFFLSGRCCETCRPFAKVANPRALRAERQGLNWRLRRVSRAYAAWTDAGDSILYPVELLGRCRACRDPRIRFFSSIKRRASEGCGRGEKPSDPGGLGGRGGVQLPGCPKTVQPGLARCPKSSSRRRSGP